MKVNQPTSGVTATSEIEIPGFRFVESAREELQAVCCPVVFEVWHESRYDFGITEHLQSDVQKKVTLQFCTGHESGSTFSCLDIFMAMVQATVIAGCLWKEVITSSVSATAKHFPVKNPNTCDKRATNSEPKPSEKIYSRVTHHFLEISNLVVRVNDKSINMWHLHLEQKTDCLSLSVDQYRL